MKKTALFSLDVFSFKKLKKKKKKIPVKAVKTIKIQ